MMIKLYKKNGRWNTEVWNSSDKFTPELKWSSTHETLLDALETLTEAYRDNSE